MNLAKLLTSPSHFLLRLFTWLRSWIAPIFAVLALGVAFFGNSLWGTEKTFIVDAIVSGATLEFHGGQNSWYMGDIKVCVPKTRRSRQPTEPVKEGVCDIRAYDIREEKNSIVTWPDSSTARLRVRESGRLDILLLSDAGNLAKNSLIILPEDYFQEQGALSFVGSAVFGSMINSGAKHILYDGQYRVRVNHVVSSLLGKGTYEVIGADLTRGEQVRVVANDNPALSSIGYGHLSPAIDSKHSVRMVFQSVPGDHALEISSFGMAKPALIRPDWIDSTLASPYVLIVGLFISLSISILEISALTRRDRN